MKIKERSSEKEGVMEEITAKSQMKKFGNFYNGFKAFHLLNLGMKLGIFRALQEAKEGITVAELASKLGLHEPHLKIWCQTAYHFEILDCDNQGLFKFQPFFDEILGDESHLNNRLGLVNYQVNITGERLKSSPDYYRTGKIMESYSPERSEIIADSSKLLHRGIVDLYFPILPEDDPIKKRLNEGAKFLEIGCGRGNFIIQLAQTFKNSRFVGIDIISHGIKAGIETISNLGLEDRVSLVHLGGEEITYNNEFDIVGMVVTFHELLPNIRVQVLENAYRAMKEDGRLFLYDFSYPENLEDFRNPLYAPGIHDQFDETCLGVIYLNADEQNEMLTNIGFKDIQRTSMQGIDIITATK